MNSLWAISKGSIDVCTEWYYPRSVATITCKIPDELNARLEAEAARKLRPKSALVREALEHSLKGRVSESGKSAFDKLKDLCGIIKDGPSDVSTNPKYMDDFGR